LPAEKKKSRKKTGGPGLYWIDVETEVKRERSQMQQCQKGKLQEIKEATYHASPRRGDISRNLGVLLYRQSTAPNVRILCASQRAHDACRLKRTRSFGEEIVDNCRHKQTEQYSRVTPCVGNILLNHISEGKTEENLGWEDDKEHVSVY
jgi:hypothetical protein